MQTCFVIQPFDGGKYDSRFKDVYAPAIRAAGLNPYRVDKDPGVDVPIDSIEEGIRNAALCLADISMDNPNVWYELGYAVAVGRPVVMISSNERTKYPFDIQHRTVIGYKTDSPSDFKVLEEQITARIKAKIAGNEVVQAIRNTESIAPLHGLSPYELVVLATVAGSVLVPGEKVSANSAQQEVERSGFTSLAFALGVKRLCEKEYMQSSNDSEDDYSDYFVLRVTPKGWEWIEKNEDKLILRRPSSPAASDEIPF